MKFITCLVLVVFLVLRDSSSLRDDDPEGNELISGSQIDPQLLVKIILF